MSAAAHKVKLTSIARFIREGKIDTLQSTIASYAFDINEPISTLDKVPVSPIVYSMSFSKPKTEITMYLLSAFEMNKETLVDAFIYAFQNNKEIEIIDLLIHKLNERLTTKELGTLASKAFIFALEHATHSHLIPNLLEFSAIDTTYVNNYMDRKNILDYAIDYENTQVIEKIMSVVDYSIIEAKLREYFQSERINLAIFKTMFKKDKISQKTASELLLRSLNNITDTYIINALIEVPGIQDNLNPDIASQLLLASLKHPEHDTDTNIINLLMAVPGIRFEIEDESHRNALDYMILNGYDVLVEEVLRKNPDATYQASSLVKSFKSGNTKLIENILETFDKEKGAELFHIIIDKYPDFSFLYFLLKLGFDPDPIDAGILFVEALNNDILEIANYIIENIDFDANQLLEDGRSPLEIAIHMEDNDLINYLISHAGTKLINHKNKDNYTPLALAIEKGSIEIVTNLLSKKADYNMLLPGNKTMLMLAVESNNVEIVRKLLSCDDINIFKNDDNGRSAVYFSSNPEITEMLRAKRLEVMPKWKGWSKRDIEWFELVLDTSHREGERPPAEDRSVCPICLAFTDRGGGCMYMSHKCTVTTDYPHMQLYQKFKNDEGVVSWCTICGRICVGHRHYNLMPTSDILAGNFPELYAGVAVEYFGADAECKRAGGGGYKEKIIRMRRMREYALSLNGETDVITYEDAWRRLVEQTWDAPITASDENKAKANKIISNKVWNISVSEYPNAPEHTNVKVNIPAPPVPYPFAGRPSMVPILGGEGINNSTLEDTPVLIKLRHRNADGTIINHEQNLSIQSLYKSLNDTINPGSPYFGKCIFHADGCTGIIYPDELQFILTNYPEEHLSVEQRASYQRLIDGYRLRFNKFYRDDDEFKGRVDANIAAGANMPMGGAGAGAGRAGANNQDGGGRWRKTYKNRNLKLKKSRKNKNFKL